MTLQFNSISVNFSSSASMSVLFKQFGISSQFPVTARRLQCCTNANPSSQNNRSRSLMQCIQHMHHQVQPKCTNCHAQNHNFHSNSLLLSSPSPSPSLTPSQTHSKTLSQTQFPSCSLSINCFTSSTAFWSFKSHPHHLAASLIFSLAAFASFSGCPWNVKTLLSSERRHSLLASNWWKLGGVETSWRRWC